jgi:hypothetical protein
MQCDLCDERATKDCPFRHGATRPARCALAISAFYKRLEAMEKLAHPTFRGVYVGPDVEGLVSVVEQIREIQRPPQ